MFPHLILKNALVVINYMSLCVCGCVFCVMTLRLDVLSVSFIFFYKYQLFSNIDELQRWCTFEFQNINESVKMASFIECPCVKKRSKQSC